MNMHVLIRRQAHMQAVGHQVSKVLAGRCTLYAHGQDAEMGRGSPKLGQSGDIYLAGEHVVCAATGANGACVCHNGLDAGDRRFIPCLL